jgi:epoxyqueuosine reductase
MASGLQELVRAAAADAGFDLCGFAPVGAELRELERLPAWLDAGRAGEMDYLKRTDDQGRLKRAAIAYVAPWARSAIVCAINYNTAQPYSTASEDKTRGWISRYAWGGAEAAADYHDHVLKRLRRVEAALVAAAGEREATVRSWCYVDTGPIVERVLAKYAGVGWIGKNTLVINQELGSWLFLGVILTSLELVPDIPAADRCGTCTACLDACPTNALTAPYQMDASRCISYLTIEKRGAIPEELRAGMGRQLFGCDICQDVCPWNREAAVTTAPEFQARPELVEPPLERIAEMSEQEFRARFRGSPITRARFSGMRRNAVVAMGNSGESRFLPLLEKLAGDTDPVLAEHARWAIRRIRTTTAEPVTV